jgi:Domain of unknown function (DUF4112)
MHDQEKSLRLTKTREQLDHLAWLLDNCFRVPGTKWRFGLEALIGLVPGAGDVVSGFLSLFLLLRAFQFRLPKIVIVRMLANSLLDFTIGAIPLIGDAFDFVFKSNTRNMRLFHEYAEAPLRGTQRHWIFLGAIIALFAGVGLLIIAAVIWAFWWLSRGR